MPVYPLDWKLPGPLGHYPHMAKHDARLWERFLADYAANFERFCYDVALGGFRPDEHTGTLDQRLGWQYSSAVKIDAVGERTDDVWIIEVRPHAGVSAIGAALCYSVLAAVDTFTAKPLVPVVLTDRASPDIRICADALEVAVIELDPTP